MMTRNKNARRWLTCSAAILLASSPLSWAQAEATSPESADSTAPASPAPEVLNAMGYAMAQSLRLNLEFTDEELDQIFAGMRALATGESAPDNLQDHLQEAQAYYFSKMQAAREREEAEREALALRNQESAKEFFADLEKKDGVQKTESGLYYELLEKGDGEAVTVGNVITLNYTGTLPDGQEFDSGQAAEFPLQAEGGLIEGFREGLQLLNVGGHIKLYIPANLGYGSTPPMGSPIEPGQPLVFDLEVLDMKEMPQRPQVRRPPTGRPGGPPAGGPPAGGPPGPPPDFVPPPPPSSPPPPPPSSRPSGN